MYVRKGCCWAFFGFQMIPYACIYDFTMVFLNVQKSWWKLVKHRLEHSEIKVKVLKTKRIKSNLCLLISSKLSSLVRRNKQFQSGICKLGKVKPVQVDEASGKLLLKKSWASWHWEYPMGQWGFIYNRRCKISSNNSMFEIVWYVLS